MGAAVNMGFGRTLAAAVLMTLVVAATARAGLTGGRIIVRVDDDAPPTNGDGASWATAYRSLQDAIAAYSDEAAAGTLVELRIAQGTYRPDDGAGITPGDRTQSFQLLKNMTIRGGYAGMGAPKPDAHDSAVYETILSGDLNGDDESGGTNAENGHHVVVCLENQWPSSLEHCTVTAGNSDGDGTYLPDVDISAIDSIGGGMLCLFTAPTITDCIFKENSARSGGGLYLRSSPAIIRHCTFAANRASQFGGGIRWYDEDCMLVGCTIADNVAGLGGGLACYTNPTIQIEDCEFNNNYATVGGGIHCRSANASQDSTPPIGIHSVTLRNTGLKSNSVSDASGAAFLKAESTVELDRCTIAGNVSGLAVGGISLSSPSILVTRCRVVDNHAAAIGGGLIAGGAMQLSNSLVAMNSADELGGIGVDYDTIVTNCTIVGNLGSGVVPPELQSDQWVQNCVLWGNNPTSLASPESSWSVDWNVSNSLVEGSFDHGQTVNVIDGDPRLVQPGAGDFRLAFGSPCVDSGSNEFPSGFKTDIAGNPRIQNGTVDMGAYEGAYDALPPMAMATGVEPDFGVLLNLLGIAGNNPLREPQVRFTNNSMVAADVDAAIKPGGPLSGTTCEERGLLPIADPLVLTTTLADGEHQSRIMLPFELDDLNGFDPLKLHLASLDESCVWRLAVELNTQASPGHASALGDRIVFQGATGFGMTADVGDYGVAWNHSTGQGFVWANVDRAGVYAIAVNDCPADCTLPPDLLVQREDLLAVIAAWGSTAPGTLEDVSNDGVVGIADLLGVLGAWGACP